MDKQGISPLKYEDMSMDTVQSRSPSVLDIIDVSAAILATTPKLHLFTSPTVNNPGLVLADFTEAVFTGYAPVVLTSALDGIDPAVLAIAKFLPQAVFTSGAVATVIVEGWYITDTAASVLLAYGFFDAPVAFNRPGDTLLVQAIVKAQFIGADDSEFIAAP
jgi:hypothetical protein